MIPLRDQYNDLLNRHHSLQRHCRDLVDHIALLKSPQVTYDEVLMTQLRDERSRTAKLEAEIRKLRARLKDQVAVAAA